MKFFTIIHLLLIRSLLREYPYLLQQDKERRLNGREGGGGGGGGGEDGGGDGAEGASLTRSRSINRHKLVAHSTAMESIQADSDPIDEEDQVP